MDRHAYVSVKGTFGCDVCGMGALHPFHQVSPRMEDDPDRWEPLPRHIQKDLALKRRAHERADMIEQVQWFLKSLAIDDERVELMHALCDGYCFRCGGEIKHTGCNACNDE